MHRRAPDDIERDAIEALACALAGLDIAVSTTGIVMPDVDARTDSVVDVAGRLFDTEVKTVVTGAHVDELADSLMGRGRPVIVVAQRIASDAKQALRRSGINFFDMRGEMRLVYPPLIIDTRVPVGLGVPSSSGGLLDSQVAKEVAIACLVAPDRPHGVRAVARWVGRAPSAVSAAMNGLRSAGLLTSAGEAMCPDLFHEMLAVWRRRSVPLAALPDPTSSRSASRLGLGLDDPHNTAGWALTDTLAAASWGMPIVARGDYPPDFYVPTQTELRAARSLLGADVDPAERACTVAVAPVRLVCRQRVDHSGTSGEHWPVVNHIVAALDIAHDRARGLEALSHWHPEGIVGAW